MKLIYKQKLSLLLLLALVMTSVGAFAQRSGPGRDPADRPVRGDPGDTVLRKADRLRVVLERSIDRLSPRDRAEIGDLIEDAIDIARGNGRPDRGCRVERADPQGRVFAAATICHLGIEYQVAREGNNSASILETASGVKTNLGGVINNDPVALTVNNDLVIFARGGDHALYYRTMIHGWISLGGWLRSVDNIYERDGVVTIIATGSDGRTYRRSMTEGWRLF